MKKPSWAVWLTKKTARGWQACLLSLNIDPDGINPNNIDSDTFKIGGQHEQRGKAPASDVNKEFARRMRFLDSNYYDQAWLPGSRLQLEA